MDLDRTLFRTDEFVRDVWQLAGRLYGFDGERERLNAPDYFTYNGELYDYDFFRHLSAASGGKGDEAFEAEAIRLLSGGYLYDDVQAILGEIDYIITYGNARYQSLKLSVCPELKGIPVHVVQQAKGPYIAKEFPGVRSILVDDKSPQAGLSHLTTFIHLDRTDDRSVNGNGTDGPVRVVSSLAEVLSLLDQLNG